MPWTYLILSLIFAVPTGYASFAFRHSAVGKIINGILSLTCFGLIAWAFWDYGWKVGLLETLAIFGGSNIGLSILKRHMTADNPPRDRFLTDEPEE